jgi:NADH:ubiquinone oxidoreductase subunit C
VVRLRINRADLLGELERLWKEGFTYLVKVTAVDYVDRITIVYIVRNLASGKGEVIEVDVAPTDAWIPSAAAVYRSADWYERELSEMFGVEIRGRRARRLLLESWDGKPAPLRKNFAWGGAYESG